MILFYRHIIKGLGLVLLISFSSYCSFGQGKGIIFGTVTDTLNAPVEFANILIQGTNSGTSTDENGHFRLKVNSDKPVTFQVSCVGYILKTVSVNILDGERKEIFIKLSALENTIEGVSIISSRYKFSNLERINIKGIDQIPNASGNFESILKSLPGVSSSNELSSQYSVRGGNFDENLIYVNGIEIYRPFLIRSGQQEGLSFVNSDMVSDVEFSSGGFNAEYGDKMSSVLNIRYRKPHEYAANIGLSLLGTNVTIEGVSENKKFSHITGFRYKTSKYLLNTLDSKGDYKPSFIDIQSYLNYDLTSKFSLSFLGGYSSNKYQFAPDVRETRFGTFNNALQLKIYYEGQEVNVFETITSALSAEYKPNSNFKFKLSGSGFVTYERETFDLLGEYWLNELDNSLGSETYGDSLINVGVGGSLSHARNFLYARVIALENSNSWIAGINKLKWGLKYQHELIDDQLSEWELIDSSGYSMPNKSDKFELSYSLKAANIIQSNRFNGYLQDDISFSTSNYNIVTTVGIRFSYWDYNSELDISPRASITIEPNWRKDISYHISGGVYYQPPFYKELRYLNGKINPNINSQKSTHIVFGTEYRFISWERPFRITGEAYYKFLNNLIPYRIDNVRIRYQGENISKGYAYGIDFKVNGELVKGAESWASLSVMRTYEDIKNDSYGQFPRPTDQIVNFGIYFQDYMPRNPSFRVHLSGHFGSGLPVNIPKDGRYDLVTRMPSYKRVDIGFSKVFKDENGNDAGKLKNVKWVKALWLSAEVFNLLNINNTVSYMWIQTVGNQESMSGRYAVPNFLTSRRLNFKLTLKF